MAEIIQPYIKNYISPEDSVLDLGCGNGASLRNFKMKYSMGIDIWEQYLPMAKDVYTEVKQYDIRKILEIIKPNSFDVVLAIDIIEHLERGEGKKLICDMISISTKCVIIYTPLTFSDNIKNVIGTWAKGNPYQIHKSLWVEEDFKIHGFKMQYYPNPQVREGIVAVKYVHWDV